MSATLNVEDAKAYLRMKTLSEDDTELLDAIIDGAEALIVQRVGYLTPTAVTSRVDVYANGDVALPHWPVLSVESVTDDGASVSTDGYLTDLETGVLEMTTAGYRGRRLTVAYTAGRTEVPADLLMALKELVRHLWAAQRGPTVRPGSAQSSELANSLPGSAYTLPIRVEQLLAAHRHVKVA